VPEDEIAYLVRNDIGMGPLLRGFGLGEFDQLPVDWQADAIAAGIEPEDFWQWLRRWYPSLASCGGPRGPSSRGFSSARLAPLVSSFINSAVLRRWDAELHIGAAHALDHIECADTFKSLFICDYVPVVRRSVFSAENVSVLESADMLTRPLSAPRGTMKVFVVDKKPTLVDGELVVLSRFIIDCTPINSCQRRPPSMGLTALHDFLAKIGSFRKVAKQDAKNYFYQFKTCEEVSAHFTFAQNRARGRPTFLSLGRAAMGWQYTPYVAMTCSRLVSAKTMQLFKSRSAGRCAVDCWVDDFIMCADTDDDLAILLKCFDEVSSEANIALHPVEHAVDGIITILGLDCNTANGTFTFTEKWRAKVADFISRCDADPSYRNTVRPIGCLVFAAYVCRIPLCRFTAIRKCMSDIGSDVQRGAGWDDPFRHKAAWPEIRQSLRDFCGKQLRDVHDLVHARPAGSWIVSQSDASCNATGARWGWSSGSHSEAASFAPGTADKIFLAELKAAMQNIVSVAIAGHRSMILFCDNLPVVYALRRGLSGNPVADAWLKRFFETLGTDFRFYITYVPTWFNRADVFSRTADGVKGCTVTA
jgi:hypothetical protein